MSKLLNCCVAALFTLPVAVLADPVTVQSETSGMVQISSPMLGLIGMYPEDYDPSGAGTPFKLHIESTIDVDDSDVSISPDGWITDRTAPVLLHFIVGDREISYAGEARTTVGFDQSNRYSQSVFVYIDGSEVEFANHAWAARGVLGEDPLAPKRFDAAAGLSGHFSVGFVYDSIPDRPGPSLGEGGGAEFASLHVISAVPEPSRAAMIMTGLMMVGVLAKRRRQAISISRRCREAAGYPVQAR